MTIEVTTRHTLPTTLAPDDPFTYGYRWVRHTKEGCDRWECVPLAFEDLLHPQEGDVVEVHSTHVQMVLYLLSMLQEYVGDRRSILTLGEVLVDFEVEGVRPVAPDVIVFAGDFAEAGAEGWGLFRVKTEGARPLLVIEITSKSNREHDVDPMWIDERNRVDPNKFRYYERVGVPYYIIIDNAKREEGDAPPIYGHRLTDEGKYELMVPEADGRVRLGETGLWLKGEGSEIIVTNEEGVALEQYGELRASRDRERWAREAAQLAQR